MTHDELARRRAEVIEAHGPWTASNIALGHGVYTMAPGYVGLAERNVQRIVQLIADHAHGKVDGLRVLDLGSYEGAFAIELSLRGASVTAVELREAHLAKLRFAKEALGLDRLEIVAGDIRGVSEPSLGTFDVVLCLGVLYHLGAQDALDLIASVAACSRSIAIFETQTSLRASAEHRDGEERFSGRPYAENHDDPGASVDNPESFWFTRPSLIRALGRAGFTTVAEVLAPSLPDLAAFRDHITVVATKGEPITPRSIPEIADLPAATWDLPEALPKLAHPAQGRRYALIERWHRRRGGGLGSVFKAPID